MVAAMEHTITTQYAPKPSLSISSNRNTFGTKGYPKDCAGCGKQINERFLLESLDLFWHEDCLKCCCCDCRLGEVGSSLYTKANLVLCKRDYLRLFGSTGCCSACKKTIPPFEMVMRAKNNVYHLECFACQQCNHRFCVGDQFYLFDDKILCEYDYEERLVFASLVCQPSSLVHIRRSYFVGLSQFNPTPLTVVCHRGSDDDTVADRFTRPIDLFLIPNTCLFVDTTLIISR